MIVKICGLTNLEQAREAASLGADMLGFVRDVQSPRFCHDINFIKQLKAETAAQIVAVFRNYQPDDPCEWADIIQSFDHELPGRDHLPVIRIQSGNPVNIHDLPPGRILLDPYHPTLGGGTGQTLDWNSANEVVSSYPGQVILAGGLSPMNVAEAIQLAQPDGVDASSQLETSPGIKDMNKVADFIRTAKTATQ